jgi:hypothetical protein
VPRPIVGTFHVTILGPLGFRLYHRITIAEGLSATYEPDARLLTADGLDPAKATITGHATLSDTSLRFDAKRLEQMITYGATRFVVTPPHMSVLHDSERGGASWSAAPVPLSTESFIPNAPGWLLIRAPESLSLRELRVTGPGNVSQTVPPHGVRRPGQVRYRLAQITDTVAYARKLDMALAIQDRLIPVASIRSRVLATGATIRSGQLKLTDCRGQPGLYVGVYPIYAPWRAPVVLPVRKHGVVDLPVTLKHVGPLRVFPDIRDSSASWPYWPTEENDSFLADALAERFPGDKEEQALSAFLAGREQCPETVDDERMWLVTRLAEQLKTDGARQDLYGQCDMRLRSYPVPALLALARTRLDPGDAVVEIIRTGLASQQIADSIKVGDARHLWGRLRVVAVLLSGGILSDPERMPQLIELVTKDHGAAFADILRGETDPYQDTEATSGRTLPQTALAVNDAVEVLSASPYEELTSRVRARPAGQAQVSGALALAMRAAAITGIRGDFRRKYRGLWTDLARAEPGLVSLDIIAAQAAVSAVDRRSRSRGAA